MNTIFLIVVVVLAINCKASTAIALHCRFEMVRTRSVEYYTCSATVLIETQTSQSVTAIFGPHQTGKGNEDVIALNIISQNLQFFPANVDEFFSNIGVIDFGNNAITSVSNLNLSPFPKLWYLNLAYNRISVLERNLFSGLNSLQVILLNDNKITSIDSNLFANLNNIDMFIDLSNNTIRHVGHDLILPKQSYVVLLNNICVDVYFDSYNLKAVEGFKFELLTNCPPTISLIESTLETRPNFIKKLMDRIAALERKIENSEPNSDS